MAGDFSRLMVPKIEPGTDLPAGHLRDADPDVPDETSAARGEEVWSKEHPPIIFGMLDPPETLRMIKGQTALMLHNENRRKVEGSDGMPLRDLPNLPRYISSKNEPIEMEFFFRSDPRVGYNDIRGRQAEWRAYDTKRYKTMKGKKGGNPLRRPNNGINNARRRAVRGPLKMRDWSTKHEGRGSKVFVRLLDTLTQEQIDHNTTWVVTERGIHPPTNPQLIFPHLAFLSKDYPHTPTAETQRSLDLLHKIRGEAAERGLSHWEDLPRTDLPSSWFKAPTVRRKVTKKDEESDEEEEDDSSESDSEVETRPKKKTKRTSGIKKENDGNQRARAQTRGNAVVQQGRSRLPLNGYGAYYAGSMPGQYGTPAPYDNAIAPNGRPQPLNLNWERNDETLIPELNELPPQQFHRILLAAQIARSRELGTFEEMFQVDTIRNLLAPEFVYMHRLCVLSDQRWNVILLGAYQPGTPGGALLNRQMQAGARRRIQGVAHNGPQTEPQNGPQAETQTATQNGGQNGPQNGPQPATHSGGQNSTQSRGQSGTQNGARNGARNGAQNGHTIRAHGATQRGRQANPSTATTMTQATTHQQMYQTGQMNMGTPQAQPLGRPRLNRHVQEAAYASNHGSPTFHGMAVPSTPQHAYQEMIPNPPVTMPNIPVTTSNPPMNGSSTRRPSLPIRGSALRRRNRANTQVDDSPEASEDGEDDGYVNVDGNEGSDADADGITDPDVSPRTH